MEHVKKNQGQYGDITCQDFQEAMFQVKKAEQMFDELPSSVRAKFQNDPSQFLDYVQDPNNAESLSEMGLTNRSSAPPKSERKSEPKKPETEAKTDTKTES